MFRGVTGALWGTRNWVLALLAPVILVSLLTVAPASGSFPGTNGNILFVRLDGSGYGDIYSMAPDGTGREKLPINSDLGDDHPAVSPDGSKITFDSDRSGSSEIYTVDATGTEPAMLTDTVGSNLAPAWSPDGTRIAFSSNRSGNTELYSMTSSGNNVTRLTETDGAESSPAWSPDGSTIAMVRTDSDGIQIYTIPADGGEATRLTQDDTGGRSPSWSPDGTQIVFERALEIWVMNADGSDPHLVADNGRASEPTFSPDGTRIAYASDAIDGSNDDIWVVDATGGTPERLTTDAADDLSPDWGPPLESGPTPPIGGRTIEGRVTKTMGFAPRSASVVEPVAGAVVDLLREVTGNPVASDTTDADGNYQLNGVPRCECFLSVKQSGTTVALRNLKIPSPTPNVIVADIDAYEQENGYRSFVEGSIEAPPGGWTGNPRLKIQLFDNQGTLMRDGPCPTSGPASTFCLAPEPGSPAGDLVYRYLAIRVRHQTRQLSRAVLVQDGVAVDSSPVASEGVVWKMEPLQGVDSPVGGRKVVGRLTQTMGFGPRSEAVTEPIAGADVDLLQTFDGNAVASDTTDADGNYQLNEAPRCECFLSVKHSGTTVALRNLKIPSPTPNVIVADIDAYEQENGYRSFVEGSIEAPPGGWTGDPRLTVELYDDTGALLGDGPCPTSGPATNFCLTSEPGTPTGDLRYRYVGIKAIRSQPRRELVRAVLLQDGVAVDSSTVAIKGVVWKMQPLHGVDSPEGGRKVVGRLTQTMGFGPRSEAVTEPIAGAAVDLLRTFDGNPVASDTTDADGNYQLNDAPRCSCFLRVDQGGTTIALRNLEIPSKTLNVIVVDIDAYEEENGYRSFVEGTIEAPVGGWDRDYDLKVQLYDSAGGLMRDVPCPASGPASTFCLTPEPGPLAGDLIYRYLGIRVRAQTRELWRAVLLQDGVAVDSSHVASKGVVWRMEPLHAVRTTD